MGLLAVIGPSTKRNSGLPSRKRRSFSKASDSRQKVRIPSSSAGASVYTGGTDSRFGMVSFHCGIGLSAVSFQFLEASNAGTHFGSAAKNCFSPTKFVDILAHYENAPLQI